MMKKLKSPPEKAHCANFNFKIPSIRKTKKLQKPPDCD